MAPAPRFSWRRNLAICLFGSFTTVFAMTLMLPFLPLYVEQLGVCGHAAVMRWSGIAYSASFLAAALATPIWGQLSDRYGRKSMLLRASLGMAVTTALIGFAATIWQLVGLRFLSGLVGGYSSGAVILIAVQAPRERSGWALGALSSGVMTGNLLGPLAGGFLPGLIGIRATFWCAGALILTAFVATLLFVQETARPAGQPGSCGRIRWRDIPNKELIAAMLATALLLMLANMSIEPIITIYVGTMVHDPRSVPMVAGLVMSAAALGSILSASRLGSMADRIGHGTVIAAGLAAASLLVVTQAFATSAWQLVVLRFAMGIALGGLLPSIAASIRLNMPDTLVGTTLGYSLSCQFAGQIVGPLLGGFLGAQLGTRAVFLGTAIILATGAVFAWQASRRVASLVPSSPS